MTALETEPIPDRAALDEYGRVLLYEMTDGQRTDYLAGLGPAAYQIASMALGGLGVGWRANPATMAHALSTPGSYKLWRYIALLGRRFRAAAVGEDPHQIWMLPSQYGKTFTLVWGIVWLLDYDPRLRVMYVTYDADRGVQIGSLARDIAEGRHADVSPEAAGKLRFRLRPDSRARGEWMTEEGGGLYCTGVKGGITGRPQDVVLCLMPDTPVATPIGERRIDTLTRDDLVWAYDLEAEQVVAKPITSVSQSTRDELIEITFTSGRSVRCTPDHPIHVEGVGYRRAELVEIGSQVPALRGVGLPGLQGVVQASRPRSGEVDQPWRRGLLLLESLLRPHPRNRTSLPRLRFDRDKPGREAVSPMRDARRERRQPSPVGAHRLRDVPRGVPPELPSEPVLLTGLRVAGTLAPDARRSQFALQGRIFLHDPVHEDAPAHQGTRRWMRRLRNHIRSNAGSPHRRGSEQQRPVEPDLALHRSPCDPPQIEIDSVSMVRRIRTPGQRFHDISVEGTSNLFAGGLLVHNCDDLLKGWQAAHSTAERNSTWNVYRSQIRMRLQSSADPIIVAGTRWHEDDPQARLMALNETEGADHWSVTRLPAIAEAPQPNATDPLLREPDPLGREPGEVLEPERFDEQEVRARQVTLGTYLAASLEQQRPAPVEGNEIKRAWFQIEDRRPDRADEWIQSVDTKMKDKAGSESSSYVVCQVWARTGKDCWLMDQVRGQWDFATTIAAVALMSVRWPEVTKHVIESAALGPEAKEALRTPAKDYDLSAEIAGLLGMTEPERAAVERVRRRGLPGVLGDPPKGDKVTRMRAVSAYIEAGDVHLWSGSDFLGIYLDELASFPQAGAHDDQVDATSQALAELHGHGTRPKRRPSGSAQRDAVASSV